MRPRSGCELVLAACCAATIIDAGSARAQSTQPTAAQVIESIKQHVGVLWREPTVDTFKAGDPNTVVTGIAVTTMATLEVLRRAAANGNNLIITHEPTFYTHLDSTAALEQEHDAVFEAKRAFIEKHHLVVWRFHDYWHARNPDGVREGMLRALGWRNFQNAGNADAFDLPPTTLGALATTIQKRLGARGIRVVGDPAARVSRIALAEGYSGFDDGRHALQQAGVDVLVIGEAREWETIEYGADAIAAGSRKGVIVLGHIVSEQAGMDACATWLKTFVKGVPITFVPTPEPFWVPR